MKVKNPLDANGLLHSVLFVNLHTTGLKIALNGMLCMLHFKRKRFTLHFILIL